MNKQEKLTFFSVKITVIFILAATALPVFLGGALMWFYPLERTTEWKALFHLVIGCIAVWLGLLCLFTLGVTVVSGDIRGVIRSMTKTEQSPPEERQHPMIAALLHHLRARYTRFWRSKVRLLLVTGEDAAIDALVPGLRTQQWLEGQRTVLIHGGNLRTGADREKLAALRTLRSGRPLDGIVQVLGQDESLTVHHSEASLRALEGINALLHWQAPVWLWQLLRSSWPQGGHDPCAVGVTFAAGAAPEDIQQQLDKLQPALRDRGMAQLADNLSHNGLLRLAQQLAEGGSLLWQRYLTPWLTSPSAVALRGLIFSLPHGTSGEVYPHALPQPSLWQQISRDKVKGRRIGLP